MAVKASLTGHLVLSTIHTNSAIGTINRLRDMGIPNYLIGSTLNLSVAQRLMRLLCDHCKVSDSLNINIFDNEEQPIEKHSKPTGCENCHFTGYKGRTALFEIIEMSNEIAEIINNNESNFEQHIKSLDYSSLKKQVIKLLREQRTSYEEAYPLLIE
jgi:type IV pilus assembly protein PilB